MGLLSAIDEGGDAVGILSFFALSLAPTTDTHPPGLDGLLHVDVNPSTELVLAQPTESWRFSLRLDSKLPAGLEMRLLPPAKLQIRPSEGTPKGVGRLGFVGESPDSQERFLIFGQTGSSQLEARRLEAAFVADLKWDADAGQATTDIQLEANAVDAKLIIDASAEGFLGSILPSDGIIFGFGGAAGLRTRVGLHSTVGPLCLEAVDLALELSGDGIALAATVDGSVTLGPILATVAGVGTAAELRFKRGDLGPVDLGVDFVPPTAIGLAIEAGVLTGGGFIRARRLPPGI
jgi:Family of unknown function (DUF6603)